jgi:cellobiose dehydrogenase (acceptor)
MTEGEPYTDAETGITLKTWTAADPAQFTFGLALPTDALETDATEYIGILVG